MEQRGRSDESEQERTSHDARVDQRGAVASTSAAFANLPYNVRAMKHASNSGPSALPASLTLRSYVFVGLLAACTERRNAEEADSVETFPTSEVAPEPDGQAGTNRFFAQLSKEPVSGVVVLRAPILLLPSESAARALPRTVDGVAALRESLYSARVLEDLGDVVKVETEAPYAPYPVFGGGFELTGYVRKSSLSPVFSRTFTEDYGDGTLASFLPGAALVTEQGQFGVVLNDKIRAFIVPNGARGSIGLSAEARDWKADPPDIGLPLFCDGDTLEKRPPLVSANCSLPEDAVVVIGDRSFRAGTLVPRCREVDVTKNADGLLFAGLPLENGYARARIERGHPTQRCQETGTRSPGTKERPKQTVRRGAAVYFQSGERAGTVGKAAVAVLEATKVGQRLCHSPDQFDMPLCHDPKDVR